MTQAYPLQWPDGMPRTERRQQSQFKTSLEGALKNVRTALVTFGRDTNKPIKADTIVISSNVSLGVSAPADPGIALYFEWDDGQRCIAVDRYPKPAENLQAIFHILEARRVEARHGGISIVRQTFKGFLALPSPDGVDWRKILGFKPSEMVTPAAVDIAWRALADAAHPDKGGSHDAMAELNGARAAAKAAISG